MAHLWAQDPNGRWTVKPLEGWTHALVYDITDRRLGEPDTRHEREVYMVKARSAGGSVWILKAGVRTDARVNAVSVAGWLWVLGDRDEIQCKGQRVLFAARSPPRVTTYLAADPLVAAAHQPACPRCHQAIELGSPAVQCPGCERWFHQSGARDCWSGSPSCASCPQPTDLNAPYGWTPQGP